ncbi:hypothetical protein [Paenirhodobacter hankyongi]|uniref:PRC-barrel domain containing protein n=1 Tax=Paenirhodobacter hankyongi TaxID=2294033 RepID=A0A421BWQ6_9RHOB|nr:hypothetical protein [Sinirhodobacter hankyongi]RLL72767.1 hypothetical protein DYS74_00105 [Sinirhodobacter hankyongi]
MKKNFVLSTALVSGLLAAPLAAVAADDPHGLIDYTMGIAPAQVTQTPADMTITAPDPGTRNGDALDQYGIADIKTGTARTLESSTGADTIPADQQLARDAGIADNKSETGTPGAVVTADDAAIGQVERVIPGDTTDTVFIRVSDTLNTNVSMFKVEVPKGAHKDGRVQLGWTLSDLLDHLEAQV